MSLLQNIQAALGGAGEFGLGRFSAPNGGISGKIIYVGGVSDSEKSRAVLGDGAKLQVEAFKVIVCGNEHNVLENRLISVKSTLKNSYVQIGGFEHIETNDGEPLQLAVTFKSLQSS